ncbi:hypothetical protein [Brooklawnia propionicigenes]|uniref:hypothetical protein n=1 Tax=Brooklawnia propionicigenes TaxID=3041175 RepID=UPI002572DBD1|nr:hypothetical protein [Brooklawnia sp. SH051]
MEAGADAVLLGLEQVDGDRVGVVGLEQLDLFGFELGLLRAQGGSFVGGRGSESVEHSPEHALDSGGLVGGDALLLVGVGDVVLDAVDEDGAALAGVALEASSGAGEVVVGDALVVAGAFVHEPLAAAAVDRPFQVVVVLLGLVTDDVVLVEDRLDPIESLWGDQRLVGAGVGDFAVGDDALVVGVGQDGVQ